MDWQAIETAPKDGTEIDVWLAVSKDWRPLDYPSGIRVAGVKWQDGAWRQRNYDESDWNEVENKPRHVITHWMAIPGAPSATEET